MILEIYIDTTHQKVSNIVMLVVRLKTTMVLTLYALTQKDQNHQLFLLGKDKEQYKEGLQGQNVFVVQELIDPNGRLSTVGGVTKKNNKTETNTPLFVNKVNGEDLDASIDSF